MILFSLGIVILFSGLLLYLLFNRKAYVSSLLLRYVPIQEITVENPLVRILRGYGADMLWSAAFTMIIQFIVWLPKKKLVLLSFCSLLGVIYELLQNIGFVTGKADIGDVIVYLLGSLFAILIISGGKFYEEKGFGSNNGG